MHKNIKREIGKKGEGKRIKRLVDKRGIDRGGRMRGKTRK
jgi:hypothetical protein